MVRSSGCLVYKYIDSELHFLLVRGAGTDARFGYGIPKGRVENESSKEAARRETLEEAGVRVGKLRYLRKINNGLRETLCYLAPYKSGHISKDLQTSHDSEISDSRFLRWDKAKSLITKEHRPFIEDALLLLDVRVKQKPVAHVGKGNSSYSILKAVKLINDFIRSGKPFMSYNDAEFVWQVELQSKGNPLTKKFGTEWMADSMTPPNFWKNFQQPKTRRLT